MTEQIPDTTIPRLLVKPLLRKRIHPDMKPQSFANWLYKAIKERGFPAPIRTGKRSCAFREDEVLTWIEARERGGMFNGRRRT